MSLPLGELGVTPAVHEDCLGASRTGQAQSDRRSPPPSGPVVDHRMGQLLFGGAAVPLLAATSRKPAPLLPVSGVAVRSRR